jgi:type II secretory pathway pseudopilin PulG
MTARGRDESGFTVIELAVAAAISLVVLGATMSLLISMMTERTATDKHADAAQQARQGMDRLARQLRNLASPADVITNSALIKPKSVDRNLPFDLVFKDVDEGALTSISNPANVRRVRYCLQTSGSIPGGGTASDARGVLWMQTQRTSASTTVLPAAPPASTACPGSGWDDARKVADFLTNASASPPDALFRYSSATGQITATDDAAREQIIRVEADLFVDPDPLRRPTAAHLTSSVVLRNQNRAPTAFFSFVVTNTLSCTLQLNGSGSEDPENKRLTYTWSRDGVPLDTGLQNRVLVQLTAPTGVHTYKLEVKDPAGLAATPYEKDITACT